MTERKMMVREANALAELSARILGTSSAAAKAIAERDRRKAAGEDVGIFMDARSALALVERKLPGWQWGLDRDANSFTFYLYPEGAPTHAKHETDGATAPLAILIALLKALNSDSSNAP